MCKAIESIDRTYDDYDIPYDGRKRPVPFRGDEIEEDEDDHDE